MLGLLCFLVLIICILTNSSLAIHYASQGLELWFTRMIPALFPFMILSDMMIRMNLTERIADFVCPLLRPILRVRKNVLYAVVIGFLCGYPMGAKVTADLLSHKKITLREAEFLLSFCNNIGPAYFCGYVLPLLHCRQPVICLIGMYGIPFLYGSLLRRLNYRDIAENNREASLHGKVRPAEGRGGTSNLFAAMEGAIQNSGKGILVLGGYMILFNLLNLLFHLVRKQEWALPAPLLEISGGLAMLGGNLPLYSLVAVSFGGVCCIAQTYSCIKDTGLRLSEYLLHKGVLVILTALYYLGCSLLWPDAF